MFEALRRIDWSLMQHAYGSAAEIPELLFALRSPVADVRREALTRWYGAVHHQGGVYDATTAGLPFLFELAVDPATSDRSAIVALLVSIGTSAIEAGDLGWEDMPDHARAAAFMRASAQEWIDLACDDDPGVRRAALPGLGLFVDDPDLLHDRFTHRQRFPGQGFPEQVVAVEALGTLTARVPALADQTSTWLSALATEQDAAPEVRLAAVAQRVRCAPDQIAEHTTRNGAGHSVADAVGDVAGDVVATAISLLAQTRPGWTPPTVDLPARVPEGIAPDIAAAFADLARAGVARVWTTGPLQVLHEALADRVGQRTALLHAQLRHPDPGTRLDGIGMCAELLGSWRGDHASLILLLGEQLDRQPGGHRKVGEDEVAAAAAEVLTRCHAIAEPARPALLAYLARHEPSDWAASEPHVRRAYQDSVLTLARLGDPQALPSLLWALDHRVDAWRAVHVAGRLTADARQVAIRLIPYLAGVDLSDQGWDFIASAAARALADLGDRAALPVLVSTLRSAVDHDCVATARSVLAGLARFGPAAAGRLEAIRTLTHHDQVRADALAALWAVGGDADEVLPALRNLLREGNPPELCTAADVLAGIGPPAAAAAPRLRELMTHDYDWVRVHAAAAMWAVTADPTVLDTLLQAWAGNPATGNTVVAGLDRMGPAAAPAVPHLRTALARPRRGGRSGTIDDDEALQQAGRSILARLATASP